MNNEDIKLYHGDCLEMMKNIEDKSVDMILCDLPYGTTACKWDTIIPFNEYIEIKSKRGKKIIMYENEYILNELRTTNKSYEYVKDSFKENAKDGLWDYYNKIIKDNGAIVLFGTQPFTSKLIYSNLEMFKYLWTWRKNKVGGFTSAKLKPLKIFEDVCVFSKGKTANCNENNMVYYPQDLIEINKISTSSNDNSPTGYARPSTKGKYLQKFTNYPNQLLEFRLDKVRIHPTQKPVALSEYFIKTYTQEDETILDNCMGSGTTGVACVNTNRKFIGIELDENYFNIAKKRICEARLQLD